MTESKTKEFVDYVLCFYGRRGIYEMVPPATPEEVGSALQKRKSHCEALSFCGDSTDRELVRDIILAKRGSTKLEHRIVLDWIA